MSAVVAGKSANPKPYESLASPPGDVTRKATRPGLDAGEVVIISESLTTVKFTDRALRRNL
jgi:hypothetical protein